MDSDELKTGSADSENGSNSDNSYVQVSQEDAQRMMDSPPLTDSPQLLSSSGMPPGEDFEETIYEDAEPVPEPVQV